MRPSSSAPKRHLTALYCLQQASYFFAIAGIGAFAAFLLMVVRGRDRKSVV